MGSGNFFRFFDHDVIPIWIGGISFFVFGIEDATSSGFMFRSRDS